MRDLLDVVHQAEEIPLRAHLRSAPERETAHALVVTDVRKHRLDRRDALAVQSSALRRVDRAALALARVVLIGALGLESRYLAASRLSANMAGTRCSCSAFTFASL